MVDRAIRIMLGLMLIGWALFYSDMPYSYLGWLGIIPLVTGAVGMCGIYKLFGISSA